MRLTTICLAASVLTAVISAQTPKKPTGVQLYHLQLSGIGG